MRPSFQLAKAMKVVTYRPMRASWAANAQDGTRSVIDLAARTVTATLNVKTFGANRLKFTPD